MIDVLDDAGAEAVITMLVEVVTIDVRAGTVIDELAAVMVVTFDMLEDMEIIVVTAVVIALESVVSVSYIVDVLTDVIVDVLSGIMIDGMSDIDVGVLADVNVKLLTAVIIVLDFVTAPSEEAIPCSLPAFSCWPNAVLDCDRVLHAWMPSYHE